MKKRLYAVIIVMMIALLSCSQDFKVLTDTQDGFVFHFEMNKKYSVEEALEFRVGIHQTFETGEVEVTFTSSLTELTILDKDETIVYQSPTDENVHTGIISAKDVLGVISLQELDKKLIEGEYTAIISTSFTYEGQIINMKLKDTFIIE